MCYERKTERKYVTGYTPRGFAQYGEGQCSHGINWYVHESSAVGKPQAWLQLAGTLSGGGSVQARTQNGQLHLSVEQATNIRDALQRFIDDAADEANWRNDPGYIAAWRSEESET